MWSFQLYLLQVILEFIIPLQVQIEWYVGWNCKGLAWNTSGEDAGEAVLAYLESKISNGLIQSYSR